MNLDKVAGKAKELKGKAKQDIGRATGGDKLAASGVKDQAEGKLEGISVHSEYEEYGHNNIEQHFERKCPVFSTNMWNA